MDNLKATPLSPSDDDLAHLAWLEQQAKERYVDLDYETLTLIPIQAPIWSDEPERDEKE